jgi:hypothetical protein
VRDSGATAAETEERCCGDGVAGKGRKLANAAVPPARGTATATGGAASDADALAMLGLQGLVVGTNGGQS